MTTPTRNIRFKVYAKGMRDQMSHSPAVLEVSNPQPDLPTGVVLSPGFTSISMKYDPPDDLDFKGMLVWLSKTKGFTRKDDNKVYDGPDSSLAIVQEKDGTALISGKTYYLKFAPYDEFGKTGLNVSSEFKIKTIYVGTDHIDDDAITTAKIVDDAISNIKIIDDAVTVKKIKDASITTAKIVDASITTLKVANTAITNAKIANAAITTAKIANASITTAKIENLAVLNAKINSLSAGKLEADSVITKRIFIGKIGLDGTKDLIYVDDKQTAPVRRVRLGKLGSNLYDYGIEIRDKLGKLIFGSNGLETKVVSTLNLDDAVSSRLFDTGERKETWNKTIKPGWVWERGGTIGSASSGASERAHADAWPLYKMFWEGYTNTLIPVSTGRGFNALADFNRNKKLTLPDSRGRVSIGAGKGTGLTNRVIGAKFGAETVSLTANQNGAHAHTGGKHRHSGIFRDDGGGGIGINNTPRLKAGLTDEGGDVLTTSSGSGSPHSNMQPSIAVNYMIKL